jgi:hypothetical protein
MPHDTDAAGRLDFVTSGSLAAALRRDDPHSVRTALSLYQAAIADLRALLAAFTEHLDFHELEAGAMAGVGEGHGVKPYLGDVAAWLPLARRLGLPGDQLNG